MVVSVIQSIRINFGFIVFLTNSFPDFYINFFIYSNGSKKIKKAFIKEPIAKPLGSMQCGLFFQTQPFKGVL